ncbi:MAG: hypothetical protein EOM69_01620 [Clostridia bacterium]|nr:hypothetical protein [Clostridia bacterium]
MLYLILAILCSSAINLGFALVKQRGCDNLSVTWMNYFTAASVSAVLALTGKLPHAQFDLSAALGNVRGTLTDNGSLTVALLFGVLTGVIYLAVLLVTQYSINRNGPSPTTMFSKLGVIIPILLSVFLWNETPSALRWVGMALALASLVVFNWDGGLHLNGLLLLTFLAGGAAELANKLFSVWCDERFKPLFLFVVFFVCVLLCTVLLVSKNGKRRITGQEMLIGAGIGVCNLSAAFFVIRALGVLPSSIVFPALCAGVILLIAVVGRFCFAERLGKRGFAAIAMTVVSLVLVNL